MISQLGIVIFGVLAIWLSQSPEISSRKWAPVFGICGQPFWFYATYTAEQWGIFAISFLYAASWLRGIRTYWFS